MSGAVTTHGHPAAYSRLRQHVRRAVGHDRNPLCRMVDRAYSRLVTALALALVAALAGAAGVGLLLFRAGAHDAHEIARHRHTVTAVTSGPAQPDDLRAAGTRSHAQARWSYPAGPGAGLIAVPAGAGAGTAVVIQVDDGGLPADAAPSSGTVLSNAAVIGVGVWIALSLPVVGGYVMRRCRLERGADLEWESAWEQVEPLWSGRR
ncbi:hypothetical protein [Kitasatospora sp. NPDC005751]|uniref:Rv1733c family protein n=1 Tax=Kitasatospora sp. NPDC005751 TaxID=3157064 RepID=UPI0033D659E3